MAPVKPPTLYIDGKPYFLEAPPIVFFEASTVGETPIAIFHFPLTQNSNIYKHIYKGKE
jgi:hypothetical protein